MHLQETKRKERKKERKKKRNKDRKKRKKVIESADLRMTHL